MADRAPLNGYVLFHRKITEWGWYKDEATFRVFIHLIICANYKPAFFMGVEVGRGQVARSLNSICDETGLSKQRVRTAIKHLILTQEITQKAFPKFTVFTIVRYDDYQVDNTKINTLPTQHQHRANTELTLNEKGNKGIREEGNTKGQGKGQGQEILVQPNDSCHDTKHDSNRDTPHDSWDESSNDTTGEKEKKVKRFVPPTVEDVRVYCESRKNKVDPEMFVDFYEASGWMRGKNKIKDWKACVRTWEGKERGGSKGGKDWRDSNKLDYAKLREEKAARDKAEAERPKLPGITYL